MVHPILLLLWACTTAVMYTCNIEQRLTMVKMDPWTWNLFVKPVLEFEVSGWTAGTALGKRRVYLNRTAPVASKNSRKLSWRAKVHTPIHRRGSIARIKPPPSLLLPPHCVFFSFQAAASAAMLSPHSLLALSLVATASSPALAATAGTFADGGNTLISAMMVRDSHVLAHTQLRLTQSSSDVPG